MDVDVPSEKSPRGDSSDEDDDPYGTSGDMSVAPNPQPVVMFHVDSYSPLELRRVR